MEYHRRVIGSHLYIADEIGSTNSELLDHAENYEHGAVFCARRQNAGRGRAQREWRSQAGGLYFSILLKDQKNIQATYPFVLLCALGIVRSIQSYSTHMVAIKWPNDIYMNHRKVCGILSESSSSGSTHHVVIGIGINVNNHVSHLTDLRHPAVSLKECHGEEIDLNNLLDRILNEIDDLYLDFVHSNFSNHLPELNRLLYGKGQEVELTTNNKKRRVTPLAFTNEARIRCLESGNETTIFLGEM